MQPPEITHVPQMLRGRAHAPRRDLQLYQRQQNRRSLQPSSPRFDKCLRLPGAGIQAEVNSFFPLGIGSSCSCHVCVVSVVVVSVVVVIVNTIATRLATLTALCRHLSSHRALAQSYHCPAPTTNVQQRQRPGISHGSADTLLAEANAGVVAGALLQHAAEPHSRTATY